MFSLIYRLNLSEKGVKLLAIFCNKSQDYFLGFIMTGWNDIEKEKIILETECNAEHCAFSFLYLDLIELKLLKESGDIGLLFYL
jgi:hypothetical protein